MTSHARAAVTSRLRTAGLVLLALVLAACGGTTVTPAASRQAAAAVSPNATIKPSATPRPTPTPTPRPTPKATPEPTPTLAPAKDIATGLTIGSPYRIRTLEAAVADRLDPVIDGFSQAYDDYFTIAVRAIKRSGTFEDVLLAFKLKSGVASSVLGSWDDIIKGATMGGTLKATTRTVSGVKVTYVATNSFGLAIFHLTSRTYRNYLFEIVAPDQAKLAAVTAAFIKANN
jgi:hypothetical protein